jgi:DNA repair protein RecO (recombination protein O)
VILRKVDYGEADRIMTLFTLERGKVPAIAKSVRKAKARMSGQLDVFAHGRMMLAEGRSMDVITQFQRLTDTAPLAEDLGRSAAAAIVVEVADKVLEERHPQPDFFRVVTDALGHLSRSEIDPRMETADFLVRVLAELGYMPELFNCARCGRPLPEAADLAFSPFAGGVIGPECHDPAAPAPPISTRVVKILRVLASGDRETFFRLRLDDQDLRALETALESQLEHHLDRQLKSVDFAHKVRARH